MHNFQKKGSADGWMSTITSLHRVLSEINMTSSRSEKKGELVKNNRDKITPDSVAMPV